MKLKAAVFANPQKPFEIREFEMTKPDKGFALIKMQASGICGTDIHIYEGKLALPFSPMVIGHEFVGEICDINMQDSADSGLKKGDRVIVNVAKACHECYLCEMGESATCQNLDVTYFHELDKPPHVFGGYADHTYAPLGNVLKIPDEVPSKTTAIFACAGPTVINAVRCCGGLDLKNVNTLVVQGLGPIGLFSVLYAKANGVKNIAVVSTGKNKKRTDLAKSFGAGCFLSIAEMPKEERVKKVTEISRGIGADCVIEASGNPDAFNEGMEMLRNRGVYLVPGLYSDRGEISIKPHMITFKALQIIGSAQYSVEDQKKYLEFIKNNSGYWDLIDSVCTHQWHIGEINEAVDTCVKGESVKAIFVNEE
ncbi:MAG: zinc-binding dehydrogenase [Oscillospiraceae bacterium]|nr:zinc-binding dehydrogenase [Oscillospiraceae bacterium]